MNIFVIVSTILVVVFAVAVVFHIVKSEFEEMSLRRNQRNRWISRRSSR